MSNTVRQFAIAKSSTGTLGLITSATKVKHTYSEGTTKEVWTGVVLQENSFKGRGKDEGEMIKAEAGMFWSSSNPEVVGYVKPQDIVGLLVQ